MIASAAKVAVKAPLSVSTSTPSSKRLSNAVASPRVSRARGVVYSTGEKPGSGVETQGPNFTPLKDIQAIMDVLPHRYPFLLVDRVLEWEYGKFAVGYKVCLDVCGSGSCSGCRCCRRCVEVGMRRGFVTL